MITEDEYNSLDEDEKASCKPIIIFVKLDFCPPTPCPTTTKSCDFSAWSWFDKSSKFSGGSDWFDKSSKKFSGDSFKSDNGFKFGKLNSGREGF